MKKYSTILFIIILSTALFCCNKNSDVQPVSLVGTWNWIRTTHPNPIYADSTPSNTRRTELLLFKNDNSWILLRNNMLYDSGTYSLGHGQSNPIVGNYIYDSVVFYKRNINQWWTPYKIYSNDTLIFAGSFAGIYGAGSQYYVKQ